MAASGMPIISSHHCDIPEVIEDGVGGLLAPERDAEALAAHIRYLAANPGRWDAMTLAARRRIERRYDVRQQAHALAEHYWSLL
jgi:colanic acid/amylovoran biosynthesis glycosyltransferase